MREGLLECMRALKTILARYATVKFSLSVGSSSLPARCCFVRSIDSGHDVCCIRDGQPPPVGDDGDTATAACARRSGCGRKRSRWGRHCVAKVGNTPPVTSVSHARVFITWIFIVVDVIVITIMIIFVFIIVARRRKAFEQLPVTGSSPSDRCVEPLGRVLSDDTGQHALDGATT